MKPRTDSRLFLIAMLATLAAPIPFANAKGTNAEQGTEFFHVFQGQRRQLTLDPTRFAVLGEDQVTRSLSVEADLPIPGWKLIRPAPGARSSDAVVTEIRSFAMREDLGFVSPVFVGLDGGPVIVTPTLLIRIDPEIAEADAERMIADQFNGEIIERDWANMQGAYRVSAASRSGFAVLDAANALAETPGVLWAEPDMLFTGSHGLLPTDPLFSQCWGLNNTGQSGGLPGFDMDCPEAWDVTTGDPSIIVAVLDNGVDPTHPDINQIGGADFTTDLDLAGAPVNNCDSHGTAVAGCVSGIINTIGGVGSAPGCVVASARPFISNVPCDGQWSSFSSWTVDALAWAESIGARISNNSNGYGFTSSAIASMYSSTKASGMVHFASAGNDSSTSMSYPSTLSSVNGVIALDRFGGRASFSNWGFGAAFSAPGQSIVTTDRQGTLGYSTTEYTQVNGTSFASPYTAGVAALILSLEPGLAPTEVELAMQTGATDLGAPGYDAEYGWGHVNALASIDRSPGVFQITAPACDSGLAGRTIAWQDSGFATDYSVEIATDIAFTNVEYAQTSIVASQHTVPIGALSPCATHYIRVTAINTFGQTVATVNPCEVAFAFPGDINIDGVVDTADLGGLVGSFGGPGPFADINGDGIVDTADLGALIAEFSQSCN